MDKQYYIASGRDHLGPFTLSQMKDKKLTPETLIWYEGLPQWTKAEDLEELKVNVPVIVSPPLTPIQVETVEKKVKSSIIRKQLRKSAKYVGIVFLIVFVLYGIVQYIALDKQVSISSEYSYNNYNSYYSNYNRMSSDDVLPTTIIRSLMMAFIMSLVSLPVFYFIEKQKAYKNLFSSKNMAENDVYQELVKKQEEKYVYDKGLNSTAVFWGYIILGFNYIVGIVIFQSEETSIALLILNLGVRFIVTLSIVELITNKNRTGWWVLFAFLFPAISLMIIGSLYPIRKEDTDKVVDKGEGYLCASDSREETQESNKEKAN